VALQRAALFERVALAIAELAILAVIAASLSASTSSSSPSSSTSSASASATASAADGADVLFFVDVRHRLRVARGALVGPLLLAKDVDEGFVVGLRVALEHLEGAGADALVDGVAAKGAANLNVVLGSGVALDLLLGIGLHGFVEEVLSACLRVHRANCDDGVGHRVFQKVAKGFWGEGLNRLVVLTCNMLRGLVLPDGVDLIDGDGQALDVDLDALPRALLQVVDVGGDVDVVLDDEESRLELLLEVVPVGVDALLVDVEGFGCALNGVGPPDGCFAAKLADSAEDAGRVVVRGARWIGEIGRVGLHTVEEGLGRHAGLADAICELPIVRGHGGDLYLVVIGHVACV
jgi:hypothetical protein